MSDKTDDVQDEMSMTRAAFNNLGESIAELSQSLWASPLPKLVGAMERLEKGVNELSFRIREHDDSLRRAMADLQKMENRR
jgi:hypothetical protein